MKFQQTGKKLTRGGGLTGPITHFFLWKVTVFYSKCCITYATSHFCDIILKCRRYNLDLLRSLQIALKTITLSMCPVIDCTDPDPDPRYSEPPTDPDPGIKNLYEPWLKWLLSKGFFVILSWNLVWIPLECKNHIG